MTGKEIIEKIAKQFNRLEKRQRMLVLLLIASILFSFYYNGIFKPQSTALRKARKELTSINNRLLRLKSQIPDIQKEKEALSTAEKRLDSLKMQLISLESELPTQRSIPQLLGELVRQASGYSVDFVSIRPKTDKEKKEYAELAIEIKFNSPYPDFANYLNRLESISQFLKTENIVMEEMKDGFRGISTVTLTMATLLGETRDVQKREIEEVQQIEPLLIKRDPFFSVFRPAKEETEKEELKLSGIIATGKQPTAIINDEVYKIGDFIDDKEVKKILPNMVVLTEGKKSTVLTFETE